MHSNCLYLCNVAEAGFTLDASRVVSLLKTEDGFRRGSSSVTSLGKSDWDRTGCIMPSGSTGVRICGARCGLFDSGSTVL